MMEQKMPTLTLTPELEEPKLEVKQETELAEKALSELVDMDVHFVAGWLSLAASRSRLGRGRDVQLALDALLEIAPPLPMYDYWVQTLSSRRQP